MLFIWLCFALSVSLAQAQELPRSSQICEITQNIGLTKVKIKYNRPNIRGREVWGKLVPYEEVWRAGANEATSIEFEHDVQVGGQALKAGRYAIFVIPRKKTPWTVIFTDKPDVWGTDYDPKDKVLSFNVLPEKCYFCESLTYQFAHITENSANLVLAWEKLTISFSIVTDTKERALNNIETAIANAAEDEWQVYVRSARYYKDKQIDSEKAMQWAEKAIEINPEHFLAYWVKAELLAEKEDFHKAVEIAKTAISYGKQSKEGDFSYEVQILQQIANWERKVK
ncbi:MAG: DUF2911 domain-containing protein [Bernardetiaceae bacterium]|nr:DUF2911 domain-containing protein [Bernardetiaceae bacterium]